MFTYSLPSRNSLLLEKQPYQSCSMSLSSLGKGCANSIQRINCSIEKPKVVAMDNHHGWNQFLLSTKEQQAVFTITAILLKYFQAHHLPRYDVDLNLKTVHCSQHRMKQLSTCTCNIMLWRKPRSSFVRRSLLVRKEENLRILFHFESLQLNEY